MKTRILAVIALGIMLTFPARAATNSWTDGTGKWEFGSNWSGGAPSISDSADLITNAGNNTATIDSFTTNSPSTLTISNLTLNANTLHVYDAGTSAPLRVLNLLAMTANANLLISNSVVRVDTELQLGAFGSSNHVVVSGGGQFISPLTTIGGLPGFNDNILVTGPGSTWVNTNSSLSVRNSSGGYAVIVSNGAKAVLANVFLGNSATADSNIVLVADAGSTWSNTGTLNISGNSRGSQFIVSNGAFAVSANVNIGSPLGSNHTAVVTGTNSVWVCTGLLSVGNTGLGHQLVLANGGALFVTNAAGTALLKFDAATLVLANGTFKSDNLVLTNGSTLVTAANLTVGNVAGTTGAVSVVDNSTLVATNSTTTIGGGSNSTASLTSSSSTLNLAQLDAATGSNSTATVTFLANTTTFIQSNLTAGAGLGSVATILVNGGNHTVNGIIGVGNNGALTGGSGTAQMTIANTSVTARGVNLGSSLGGHGIMTIQPGAILHIVGGCAACGFSTNEGELNGGTIDSTNAPFWAGMTHAGEFIISNGVATFQNGFVGFDNLGSLTQAGGTLNVLSNLVVGTSVGATGVVTMTGGSVFVTNGVFAVGNGGSLLSTGGVGHVTLSNGVVESASVLIGDNFGSDANLTVAGTGTVRAHGGLRSNGIRTTVVNGGTLEVVLGPTPAFEDPILHDRIVIGYLADGKMIVSNGTARTPGLLVAASAGNTGTLELPGGITSVYSNMTVGFIGCASTGIVTVAGGSLYVTNGGTAVLEVRSGTFTLSAGTVVVDKLVITNACARLLHTGGTLVYSQLVLDPNQSAVGDGIPNGWKQQYGLDPFDPNLGSRDGDGDGMSNLQEYLAGTDPTNNASAFRITSVIKTSSDVRVTWTMGSNKTNALQFANGGNYTTNFTDLFTVTNAVGTSTNYLDLGGATNAPSRYYRVRLIP
ncbi:MAG TPA: Amuc_1099 family pilus-like system protein [Verrucomicrobiae bacterium]|nr:Amuc_1099 family pilus-like system protein [Verrucomicrobiae bacterium]